MSPTNAILDRAHLSSRVTTAQAAAATPQTNPHQERIVVVGGNGFIGQYLMRSLAGAAWADPVCASRTSQNLAGTVAWAPCDAIHASDLHRVLDGAGAVVNLVCGSNRGMIAATRNLLEAARAKGVRRVVHVSSMAVYAAGHAAQADETAARVSPGSIGYAAAKMRCEDLARHYAQSGGDVVVLRPGCVYGPHGEAWSARIGRLLQAGRLGQLGPQGEGFCNLVYAGDLAKAITVSLYTTGIAGEVFNIVSPEPVRWNDYLARYADLIGTPPKPVSSLRLAAEARLIAPGLKIAQSVGQRLGLGKLPDPISPGLRRALSSPMQLDGRKADRRFGLRYLNLDEGLQRTAAWFHRETATG
jgi:nucleoside-diphosphate-sugar epimerase